MMRNLVLFLLFFSAIAANAQYSEQFNVANKGYLINNVDDITGINWSLSPWNVADRDAGDYFSTTAAGKLECVDLDNEVCWESPLINISAGGTVTFAVDLSWTGFDSDVLTNDCILYPGSATLDYIRVMYSVNGGGYVLVPNQVGGAVCATIGYTGQNPGPHNSNTTVNQGGISGTTLKIRVCVGTNAQAEVVTIDNVSVPQAGVFVGCAAPTLTTAVTPVGCLNPNSGAINLSVSAGTPPYTYDWSNDGPENPDNDPQDLNGLAVGTYTVTVTDASGGGGCSATISATVGNNPAITLTSQVLDVSCAGNLDGEIDLGVSGGTGPYTYDWSNDGPENPDNDPQDLVGMGQGTFTVTVTDAVSCTATRSATIGLQPSGAYLEQFNVPNKGYLTGFAEDFSAVAWTLSAWANEPGVPFGRDTDDFFRTNAGKLEAVDLDQEVCWESPLIDFSGATMFSVDLAWTGFDVQVDEYINVNYSLDGGAFVQVANLVGGGAGTIQYTSGLDQSGSTTVTKNGLSGSTIKIQVCGSFNANAETMTIDNVSVPGSNPYCPAPEPTLVPTHVTCNGANNGSIDLSVTNGSTPYTYDWSNDGPENPDNDPQDLSGLAPGTYTVTVTDANMLTGTASVLITEPPLLTLSATQVNPTNCNVNNGSIDLTVNGGTSPYTYDWSNDGPENPDNDLQDLTAVPTGTYTVTVTDAKGCTQTTSRTLTYTDNVPPTITCPANATVNANASCQGQVGSYSAATLNDNCNPAPTVTQSPASNTLLSGHNATQTVTLTANDGNGNTASCTLTVTLKDVTPPAITCPANATVNANASCQGMVGSYSATSLSDNCNPSPTVTQSPVAATILSGHNTVQTVTLTANDGNGNTSTCTLTVTLKDVTPPSVTCQGNVTINANASCQGTLGLYTLVGNDNCTPSLAYGQDPGDGSIISGHNTVQVVTLTASDNASNTATCTLTVTLKDVTPPTLSCPANVTVAANASCQGTVGTHSPTTLSDNCNPSPTVVQSPASGTALTGHNDAETVTFTASDGNGNTSTCSFTVTLKDVTPPAITCPANVTVNVNASCQGMVGSYSATSLSDNCNPSPTVTQSPVAATILTGHNTVQTVTLTANDGNGNTSTCTLTVTLKDVTPPSVTCQGNVTINANASCQGTLGLYTLVGNDNCTPSLAYGQDPSDGSIISGHNTVQVVTLTASDNASNTATCTLTVTLKDVTPPTLSCPANVTVAANASCQGTVGTHSPTTLSDNCNPSPTVVQSPASGTALIGHNDAETVTFTASDGNGNTSTCSFTVTLKDVTPPAITCPANATVNANASCQGTVGSYSLVSNSDNCNPSPTVTQSPVAATLLTGHNTVQTVTLTANDGNGNTSTCTLTVTLKDVTPPSVTCPANITINASASCQGAVGAFSAVTLADNCNPSPTVVQTPTAGTLISGHNTVQTVTLTANDGNGNTSTCTLTVTLTDVTPPVITCPANVTVAANASCQGTVGTRIPASLSDNCNPVPTVTQSPAAGTLLIGHNDAELVTLTANDGNGNTASCSFTVTLKDVTPPNVTCPGNITINANASCQGTIGSYLPSVVIDNCNPSPSSSQSPAAGTIISGHNTVQTVTLTANDGNGNSQNCTFTVTLRDVTPPSIVCRNHTADLNASGTVTILNSDVFQSGSDNCGVVNLQSVTPATFTCANIGANTVVLTANDGRGNTSTCSAVVTVRDVTAPVARCRNFTADIGPSGSVTVPASAINNGTTDNCSFSLLLTPSTFTCANLGAQTVVLRATDTGGNSSTCTATVTVRDLSGPTALCKNPTIFLNSVGEATLSVSQVNNGSFDNCGISTISISKTSFNCSELAGSPQPVTLNLTDINGNNSSCLAYVTVRDAIAPTAVCEDVTVQLNAMGRATVYGADLASESTDNCAVWSYSPIAKVYNTSHIGDNSLTVTVRDWSGNTATCISIITVLPYGSPDPFTGSGGGEYEWEIAPANLSLYPNPTAGELTAAFELPADEAFVLRIFDASGRLIFARQGEGMQGENYLPLQLEDIPSGLYMVDLKCESWQIQQRLMVQRN